MNSTRINQALKEIAELRACMTVAMMPGKRVVYWTNVHQPSARSVELLLECGFIDSPVVAEKLKSVGKFSGNKSFTLSAEEVAVGEPRLLAMEEGLKIELETLKQLCSSEEVIKRSHRL